MPGSKARAIKPATWNGVLEELAGWCQSVKITSFVGGTFDQRMSGTALSVDAGGGATAVGDPYLVSDASTGGTPGVRVRPGTHNGFMPQIYGANLIPAVTIPVTPAPTLTLTSSAQYVYVEFDGTYDQAGQLTITDGSIHSTNSTVPASTVTSAMSGSGGTFSFYEALAAISVSISTGGTATVTVYQLIQTVRTIYLCGPTNLVVSS